MSDTDFPLPPATFEFLVFSLKMQAELRLGIVAMPGEPQEAPDLRTARHTIDMLAMIQEKTRGNLSMEEQRLIENSLTALRFRFVQASEEAAKARAQQAKPTDEPKLQNEPSAPSEPDSGKAAE